MSKALGCALSEDSLPTDLFPADPLRLALRSYTYTIWCFLRDGKHPDCGCNAGIYAVKFAADNGSYSSSMCDNKQINVSTSNTICRGLQLLDDYQEGMARVFEDIHWASSSWWWLSTGSYVGGSILPWWFFNITHLQVMSTGCNTISTLALPFLRHEFSG